MTKVGLGVDMGILVCVDVGSNTFCICINAGNILTETVSLSASALSASIVTLLVHVPTAVALIVMLSIPDCPLARLPIFRVNPPEGEHTPLRVLVKTTPSAVAEPAFPYPTKNVI